VTTLDDKYLEKTGRISAARVVQEADEVTLISANGVALRLRVKDVSVSGRATRGTHIMDIAENDVLASIARISEDLLSGSTEENS